MGAVIGIEKGRIKQKNKMDNPPINRETQFNAGVDIALNISKLIKEAEYFASAGDYSMWHIKLEAIERRISPKIRKNKESMAEIEKIKEEHMSDFRKYLKKLSMEKHISNNLANNIKIFLSDYEKALLYWRDVFGYGMPSKDDSRFVLG